MKERKNIAIVVFGVAFVALIITVISGLFDAIFILKDSDQLVDAFYYDDYNITVGKYELIGSILGIVFCLLYVLEYYKKRNRWFTLIQCVSSIVVFVFFIVAFINLRSSLPRDKVLTSIKEIYVKEYALFVACFNILTNIIILEMIVFVSYLFIKRIKKMELKQERIEQMQKALELEEEKMFK